MKELILIFGLKTLSIIILAFIGCCFLSIVWILIWYKFFKVIYDRQKAEYDKKYKQICYQIETTMHSPENYDSIQRQLLCLGNLPYKNREITELISQIFWIVWTDERKKKINEFETVIN